MQKILVKRKPMYGISFIAYKTEILVTRVPDSRLHTNLSEKTNMPRVEPIKDGLMEQFIPHSPHKHHDLTQFTVLNFTFQRFRWIRNLNGAGVNRVVAKTSILTFRHFPLQTPINLALFTQLTLTWAFGTWATCVSLSDDFVHTPLLADITFGFDLHCSKLERLMSKDSFYPFCFKWKPFCASFVQSRSSAKTNFHVIRNQRSWYNDGVTQV